MAAVVDLPPEAIATQRVNGDGGPRGPGVTAARPSRRTGLLQHVAQRACGLLGAPGRPTPHPRPGIFVLAPLAETGSAKSLILLAAFGPVFGPQEGHGLS